jgi:hypothetical protein
MNPVLSIVLMAVGSICAASFYVPIRKVRGWSWESYWIVQGLFSWIIVPLLFAWVTVPAGTLGAIISQAPASSKLLAIFYGALWGIGGLTFGLSMRYLGVAMGQSVALGLCAAIGTLIPPLINGQDLFADRSGILMLTGVSVSIAGIAIIGFAASLKNRNLSEQERRAAVKDFALKKGILIAILSGIMSACFNFGLTAGEPLREAAVSIGAKPLFAKTGNIVRHPGRLHYQPGLLHVSEYQKQNFQGLFLSACPGDFRQRRIFCRRRYTLVHAVFLYGHGRKHASSINGGIFLEYPDVNEYRLQQYMGNHPERVEGGRQKDGGYPCHRYPCTCAVYICNQIVRRIITY